MFIAGLLIIARTWKKPRGPLTDEWIYTYVCVCVCVYMYHTHRMEYYSAIKRNTFESATVRWMNLEPIIQSEVSQKEKDKYCILTHIYGIWKKGPEEFTAGQPWRSRHREQTYGHSRGGRRREWEVWREYHESIYYHM